MSGVGVSEGVRGYVEGKGRDNECKSERGEEVEGKIKEKRKEMIQRLVH